MADSLLAGGSAWYSVIAGVLPVPSVALMTAIRKGDDIEVRRISVLFQQIWELFQELGNIKVVFALANELDLCKAAPPWPILPKAASHQSDSLSVGNAK